MTTSNIQARFGSGKAVLRVEDQALLTGRGQFTDDVPAAGVAHMCFVRSPHAHAHVAAIDAAAATRMPGVLAVITGADLVKAGVKPMPASIDFKRADGGPVATPPEHSLAVDVARHVGEAVAAVVATTRVEARDAAEAVVVDYEPLPAVAEAADAAASGAPLVWPEATGNVAAEIRHGDVAATDAAFKRAAHVVTLDLVNQRVIPAPMEPRATLAEFDAATGRLTLRVSCQTPTGLRDTLCDMFGIAQDRVRVVVGDIGGGFGMKTRLYAEDVCVAYCARMLKRPVKWCADRLEEFLAASHGRDLISNASLALDANGRVLALRISSLANLGSHATPAGVAIQLMIGPWVSTSVYDIQTIDIHIKGILTHTTPTGPYRGAGRPEAIYTIERLMDAASRKTGIDPIELRRRNMIRPEQMPYKNPMGRTYDSGQFAKVMDAGVELADWRGFDARAAQSKARGRLRGRGISTFLEWTGVDIFEEKVTVTVDRDEIEIFSATQAMGTGLATTYAQLVVDVFGVPLERIRISQGDTDRGTGFGSAGSRSIFIGGSAVRVASERTVDKAKALAATELEAAVADIEYANATFRIAGTDRAIGLFELAHKQRERRIELVSVSSVDGPTWPNGCHVAEVEIDPDTGVIDVVAYSSVNDVGRVVNPMIVIGQLDGGAVQGIGQALTERFVFDSSGQALTASFLDYALPLATHAPPFRTTMDESTLCRNNAMGIKGVGELGTIGATPAVVNAVVDAFDRAGRGDRISALQMPLTPSRVWEALQRNA